MLTDPIADLLTRIRNAQMAGHSSVVVPASKMREALLKVFAADGYIAGYSAEKDGKNKAVFRIALRYDARGNPVIKELKRISRPGRRVYVGKDDIPLNRGGLGVVVISTSKGLLSDHQARIEKMGGEVVCSVF